MSPTVQHVYETVRAIVELAYFLAGAVLAFVAFRALEQIRVAKRDLEVRVKREAAKESSFQIAEWATKVIPQINKAVNAMREKGLEVLRLEMERYDMAELLDTAPLKYQQHQQKVAKLASENREFRLVVFDACNMVEASAMNFMTGVADEEIAFLPVSAAFCPFVEMFYPVFCGMRQKDQLSMWNYTVQLYGVWSQRRKKYDLTAKQEEIADALAKASKASGPISPIGAK